MSHSANRRQFLSGSIAAAAALGTGVAAQISTSQVSAAPGEGKSQEYYELREYTIETADQQQIVSGYLKNALLPALGRLGINRVGVFTQIEQPADQPVSHNIFVLIPYPTLDALGNRNKALAADATYQSAAAELFSFPKQDAPYKRINSRFMKAFAGMPVIEMPAQTAGGEPRIFELRTYESHNEEKADLKVDMFNSGEIDVMRDVKMAPVFFGEMLIGDDVPNLTYMLSASDMDAHKEHWKGFSAHPEWNRMKKLPKYAGTVSKITKWYLAPTDYSQI